jgi:hypothetical protein
MMVLDADMIKELHKLTDKTISQIPLMATWLSSKDLQWPLLQITDESDFLKGAVVSQVINLFGIFMYFGCRKQHTSDESILALRHSTSSALDLKPVLKVKYFPWYFLGG